MGGPRFVTTITLNGFTPPASGRVTVKVRGRTGGGARTLLGNLPEGVTKANFALDKTGLPGNVSLTVQDGSLFPIRLHDDCEVRLF